MATLKSIFLMSMRFAGQPIGNAADARL